MQTMMMPRPTAGVAEDVEREDDTSGPDDNGYEPEEFHRLVRRLVRDGDLRAAHLGRRARRTLAEMTAATEAPPFPLRSDPHERDGRQEQEQDVRPHPQYGHGTGLYEEDPDRCAICEHWTCVCGTGRAEAGLVPTGVTR